MLPVPIPQQRKGNVHDKSVNWSPIRLLVLSGMSIAKIGGMSLGPIHPFSGLGRGISKSFPTPSAANGMCLLLCPQGDAENGKRTKGQ